MHGDASRAPLTDIIVPPQPEAAGAKKKSREKRAMLSLSETLARDREAAVQRLAEVAMELTNAESAGVSLEETSGAEEIFRWIATAGEFARYANGTMPRHFSPCGEVLDRGRTLVMRKPVRHYEYIAQLHAPIEQVLLVPFGRRGRLVGTVWVVTHTGGKSFTTEDARVVEQLTTFATAILDATLA